MTPLEGFERHDGALHCEQVPLTTIAAEVGTPSYVYSASAIRARYRAYAAALQGVPHELHFAVKANSSLAVLALLAREGAGFDIVSGGELFRVIQAGGDPRRTVFSGVGKTAEEIDYALESGVASFNCESEGELAALRELAARRGRAPSVALRVNPDISAETHPYISTGLSEHKFGIPIEQAERIYQDHRLYAPLVLDGLSCHIGSQIFDLQAFDEAAMKMLALVDRLKAVGLAMRRLDLGGGLGVGYHSGEASGSITEYGAGLRAALAGRDLQLQIEPGRSIVGRAGALLTKALYRKQNGEKVFVIVDAAMNDLIRPSLYKAHHEIVPVLEAERPEIQGDVVGPVCESGDFLARDRRMPDVRPGELLAIATAGAYGSVLSSNYNSRPRAAEVLVEGDQWRVIRRRETYADLIRGETT